MLGRTSKAEAAAKSAEVDAALDRQAATRPRWMPPGTGHGRHTAPPTSTPPPRHLRSVK